MTVSSAFSPDVHHASCIEYYILRCLEYRDIVGFSVLPTLSSCYCGSKMADKWPSACCEDYRGLMWLRASNLFVQTTRGRPAWTASHASSYLPAAAGLRFIYYGRAIASRRPARHGVRSRRPPQPPASAAAGLCSRKPPQPPAWALDSFHRRGSRVQAAPAWALDSALAWALDWLGTRGAIGHRHGYWTGVGTNMGFNVGAFFLLTRVARVARGIRLGTESSSASSSSRSSLESESSSDGDLLGDLLGALPT